MYKFNLMLIVSDITSLNITSLKWTHKFSRPFLALNWVIGFPLTTQIFVEFSLFGGDCFYVPNALPLL